MDRLTLKNSAKDASLDFINQTILVIKTDLPFLLVGQNVMEKSLELHRAMITPTARSGRGTTGVVFLHESDFRPGVFAKVAGESVNWSSVNVVNEKTHVDDVIDDESHLEEIRFGENQVKIAKTSKNLPPNYQNRLKSWLEDNSDIFSDSNNSFFKDSKVFIHFDKGLIKPSRPLFVSNTVLRNIMRIKIQKLVSTKKLVKTNQIANVNAFLVAKSNSYPPEDERHWRLVTNMQPLNGATQNVTLNLGSTLDQINKLSQEFCHWTTLDIADAFHSLEYEANVDTVLRAAGLDENFKYCCLPQGLVSAPGLFQSYIEQKMDPLKDNMTIWLDDCLVGSKTVEDHFLLLDKIAVLARENNIKFSSKKSIFISQKIRFLGFVVYKNHVGLSSDYKNKILQMQKEAPHMKPESRYGFLNYLRSRIQDRNALHLMKTQKWTKAHDTLLEKLIREILENDKLLRFDENSSLNIFCDASDSGVSAVLAQGPDLSSLQVVEIANKFYGEDSAYQKSSTFAKEVRAIDFGLEKFQKYCYGSNSVKIFTDARNFASLTKSHRQPEIKRLQIILDNPKYEIILLKSEENILSDFFSRNFTKKFGSNEGEVEVNTYNVADLSKDAPSFTPAEISKILDFENDGDSDTLNVLHVKQLSQEDWDNCPARKLVSAENLTNEQKTRLVSLLKTHHLSGHLSAERLYEAFLASGIKNEPHDDIPKKLIHEIFSHCSCRKHQSSKFQNKPAPSSTNELIYMDIKTVSSEMGLKNPEFKYLLSLREPLSGHVCFFGMASKSGREIISHLSGYFQLMGKPKVLYADNAKEFKLGKVKEFLAQLGIEQNFSADYSPNSNQAELNHRLLNDQFKNKIVTNNNLLSSITDFAVYRNSIPTSNGSPAPFFVLSGKRPPIEGGEVVYSEKTTGELVKEAVAKKDMKMAIKVGDSKFMTEKRLESGTKAWLELPPLEGSRREPEEVEIIDQISGSLVSVKCKDDSITEVNPKFLRPMSADFIENFNKITTYIS